MDEHLYALAVKFLARRPKSEKEMRDYLFKKIKKFLINKNNIHNELLLEKIEEIISKLKKHKFINDYEFAKWWVEQRTRFKTMGKHGIEVELKNKGIGPEIIKMLRDEYKLLREKSEVELAKELIGKRIKRYQNLSKHEIYTKLGGFLTRRGFDYDTVKTCIDEILGK